MSLQFVLGFHVLLDTIGEGTVDVIPLVDHGRGAFIQQGFDFDTSILKESWLLLIVIRVFYSNRVIRYINVGIT